MGGINGWMADRPQPPLHTLNCIMDWRFDSKDPKGMRSVGIKCPEVWSERIRAAPGPQGQEWSPGGMCCWQLPGH